MSGALRLPVLFLFTVSGFAGLIYESLWTQYLKLFLGHAAFAQTLVLAIFMGGLAAGSWLAGRAPGALPLRRYALVEAAVGIIAIAFHPLYLAVTGFAFDVVLPAAGSAGGLFKWLLAGALILPQSVLLGMTFPLMTAGLLRRAQERPGDVVATLYFVNSLGGAVGVLAAGFVLVGWLGLPGTMVFAGALNLLVAACAWALGAEPGRAPAQAAAKSDARGLALLLACALLTGATSFAYEIGWIRLLSMVLGASTHSFEIMLAAFILGLALGGLWIRRRIDRLDRPLVLLAMVQVAMGLLAASTLLTYGTSFRVMKWLMATLERTDAGYLLFNLSGLGLSMLLMLPATICAGMTLPLITVILMGRGQGEGAVGRVYAANTLGGILGVVFSLHVGLPVLGLEGLMLGAGAADVAVGLVLLATLGVAFRRLLAGTAAGAALGLAGFAYAGPMDRNMLSSGVYRNGSLGSENGVTVAAQRHGKTASIHVTVNPSGTMSIRTNGKPDAAVAKRGTQPQPDEATMLLVGALPQLLRPEARNVANIGFGSGLTSHALLYSTSLAEVDNIEIEPAIVELAQHFRPANERAYTDPRSRFHFDDAKSFFASGNRRWDLITSEPSNPWVSGVAGLFSSEFYATARRHLAPGGLLVQWMHLYEIEPALVSTVFLALGEQFSDYVVYASNQADILIAASPDRPVGEASMAGFANRALAADLARFGINGPEDMALRKVGDRASLHPLFAAYGLGANSDYRPVLDQGAARSRFLRQTTEPLITLRSEPLPALEMLSGDLSMQPLERVNPQAYSVVSRAFHRARMVHDHVLGRPLQDDPWTREFGAEAAAVASACARPPRGDRVGAMIDVAMTTLAYLPPADAETLWRRVAQLPCGQAADESEAAWSALFLAVSRRDAEAMAANAERLLAGSHNPVRRRYLTAAAMLGRISAGDKAAARAVWERESKVVESGGLRGLLFPLLTAHSRN